MSKPKPLPLIACFHGSGSNASIYEIQCSFLTSLLSDTFRLEFFEGPFTRPAGPGVLPAFEGYGPYKSWFDTEGSNKGDGSGFGNGGEDGVRRVWGLMEERLKERRRVRMREGRGEVDGDKEKEEQEEWVGVMGFSQGSRVAGGLLLDQQRRGVGGLDGEIEVRFGVCCMGGGAPMEAETGLKMENPDTVVRIPTLHLHGLKDEYLSLGRDQLARHYDSKTASLYEINYHHAMPWVKAESEELARRIKELYNKTKTQAEKSR